MEQLNQIIFDSTKAVERTYFSLSIESGSPVHRERVYSYELYHQMRKRWPLNGRYCINGEVDKSGHPILGPLGIKKSIPDLLVHEPGYMNGNYAVIEIKHVSARAEGIRSDLLKLTKFLTIAGYRRAIYLFYGQKDPEMLIKKIHKIASKLDLRTNIEVWLHAEVGHGAVLIVTISH